MNKKYLCGNAGDNVELTFRGGCRKKLKLEESYRCVGCGGRFHKECIVKHFELEKGHDVGRKEGYSQGYKSGLLKAVEVAKNSVAPIPEGDSPNKMAHVSSWTTAKHIAEKLEALCDELHEPEGDPKSIVEEPKQAEWVKEFFEKFTGFVPLPVSEFNPSIHYSGSKWFLIKPEEIKLFFLDQLKKLKEEITKEEEWFDPVSCSDNELKAVREDTIKDIFKKWGVK